MTILSAFAGGLWIIPLGLLLAALYSFYRGYKQSKSGSLSGLAAVSSDENVPFWKCGATVFGYILLAAAIGAYIWMKQDA